MHSEWLCMLLTASYFIIWLTLFDFMRASRGIDSFTLQTSVFFFYHSVPPLCQHPPSLTVPQSWVFLFLFSGGLEDWFAAQLLPFVAADWCSSRSGFVPFSSVLCDFLFFKQLLSPLSCFSEVFFVHPQTFLFPYLAGKDKFVFWLCSIVWIPQHSLVWLWYVFLHCEVPDKVNLDI